MASVQCIQYNTLSILYEEKSPGPNPEIVASEVDVTTRGCAANG